MTAITMKSELHKRLLWREFGERPSFSGIRGIYGDKAWVDDLDIVNELGGHTGCVNALSWSTSGKLLASGSDDHHLNIYSYQPESSNVPFTLNTTLLTGHSANIFSVKFMPHSNDRTLVSCAGDAEVRVFDIEYSGRSSNGAEHAASARSRRFNSFFNGMYYMTEGNANARVYRSHADRVKRIVTESSPYLFLTCSEDGEVRQWDLRQPSSAYPSPAGGQGFMSHRRPGQVHDDSNVPPPLISYKKYHIDLNTISCAANQPHYIALGGGHLHCFLHDRRMMGRDLLAERGQMGSPAPSVHDDEAMNQATRCVRRFAPNGQKKMRKKDNGHITACKISNARPNEMIVGWSGDHIYSFDLVRSPDARDVSENESQGAQRTSNSKRAKESKSRKRKREKIGPSPSPLARRQSRRRSKRTERAAEEMSFRVRYGNGESEEIPFDTLVASRETTNPPEDVLERARESVLNDAQRLSLRIAKGFVEIRKLLFSVETSLREAAESRPQADPTPYTESFTSVLGYAATYLPQMDEVIRTWRYPLNPSTDDVLLQQALRRNRESARRFVQASGTLARVLGGQLHTASQGESPQLESFRQIEPAPTENGIIDPSSMFCYDFLKAILLWLEHGRQEVVRAFTGTPAHRHDLRRFPIPEGSGDEAIEGILIPYLQNLAREDEPIINVDASRFEHDDTRVVFESEVAAVRAFSEAIKLLLEDLGDSGATSEETEPGLRALNRRAAIRFWGLKVGRGLLMSVGEGVNFEFVNRAFGGLRAVVEEDDDEDDGRERLQEDIDPEEEEERISDVRLTYKSRPGGSRQPTVESTTDEDDGAGPADSASGFDDDDDDDDSEGGQDDEEENEDGDENDDDDDQDSEDNSSDSEEESEVLGFSLGGRGKPKVVEGHVPCSSHLNVYRGHCNVQTVKDVNYFGLDDEYVVSGSDCGNFFIWDRKTSSLVNILSGDSDVVNVVQGHPYEPTIAVSGIDHTIKIFSPDARAQHNARLGINIADPDAPTNTASGNPLGANQGENRDLGLRSRKRMQDSYQIMSQNDVSRQGGVNDAFITRSMLARVAATLRERQAIRLAINPEGEEGGTVVLHENCNMM